MKDTILIYADGGCRGNRKNDNVGGWGVFLKYNDYEKTLYGGTKNTTNNKMELTSVIKGLKACKKRDVQTIVVMDSSYVVDNLKWVPTWKKKNWRNSKNKPVKNKELWEELYKLVCLFSKIQFKRVKGHSGIEGNEIADSLANKAMDELEFNNPF